MSKIFIQIFLLVGILVTVPIGFFFLCVHIVTTYGTVACIGLFLFGVVCVVSAVVSIIIGAD